jgi:hypothetical protein
LTAARFLGLIHAVFGAKKQALAESAAMLIKYLKRQLRRLGHRHLDVLKLDVEGSEFEAIPDLIDSGVSVDQLLVEIHYQFRSRSFRLGLDLIQQLKAYGMQCIHISPPGFEFSFVRRGLTAAERTYARAA